MCLLSENIRPEAIHPMFGFFTPKKSMVSIMVAVLSMQVLGPLVVFLCNPGTLALLTALVICCRRYILRIFAVCLQWLLRQLLWTIVGCCLTTVLCSLVQAWFWCSFVESLPLYDSVDVSTCMQNAAWSALSAMCGSLFALCGRVFAPW